MRVKIEYRWGDGDWTAFRENVNTNEHVPVSVQSLMDAFAHQENGTQIIMRGWNSTRGREYRYTKLPDPVKRKVVRRITPPSPSSKHPYEFEYPSTPDVARGYFCDVSRNVGDYIEYREMNMTFRYELVEIEVDA